MSLLWSLRTEDKFEASGTNSIMPSFVDSAMTWYVVSCMSRPYFFRMASMRMISCRTSWSCLRSSPSLTIIFFCVFLPRGPSLVRCTWHVRTAGFMADLSRKLCSAVTLASDTRGSTGSGTASSSPSTRARRQGGLPSSGGGGSRAKAWRKRSTFFSIRSRFITLEHCTHHSSFLLSATCLSSICLAARPSADSPSASMNLSLTRWNTAPFSLSSVSATTYQ
mmetsp:Transcript_67364/g.196936  ORF Transcript_67364/g.196936 Transcript_67364/m.196936 type:complete len:222 (-) Transcript_67364:1779-2444(-)